VSDTYHMTEEDRQLIIDLFRRIGDFGSDRTMMADLAEVVGSIIMSRRDAEEGEAISWGNFLVDLCQFMGSSWGYGHVGPHAANLALYGILGEHPGWPKRFDGGVPPIWDVIQDAYDRKFGSGDDHEG
jgi:hypothetical protein